MGVEGKKETSPVEITLIGCLSTPDTVLYSRGSLKSEDITLVSLGICMGPVGIVFRILQIPPSELVEGSTKF